MAIYEKCLLFLMSLGNLVHIIQPMGQSELTWSTGTEKRHVLAAEVMHGDRSGSTEGSGQQISIFKELDLLLSDRHETKSAAISRGIPVTLEKTSIEEGQGRMEDNEEDTVRIIVVTSKNYQNSEPKENCSLEVSPCLTPNTLNGTRLVWDDMQRTLAFAWELHVYGSASLSLLLVLMGVLGMIHTCTLPHLPCDVLTMTNSFVVFSALLRGVLLLLDPYGTRQILSQASFTALHNVSLHLLLWAQSSMALLTLQGLTFMFVQLDEQHWWVIGALGLVHCSTLVVADLYPSAITHGFPLLLQTLSLFWGIPLGLGIAIKALYNFPPFLKSFAPQWKPSRRDMCAKRVTAACAILGVMSSTLHMYSLLWLYGLIGNWKRFSWPWWLCQFWGRILELFWGFSLLVLGFWISCTLSKRQRQRQKSNSSKYVRILNNVLSHFKQGSKYENSWEELMPNNWEKYKLSRPGISNKMASLDDQPYKPDLSDPVSTTSCDSQAAGLWQKVSERECVLSLIDYDMGAPSPINLRRSIDNALSESLFIAPPPSWILPPAYSSLSWPMDTESITSSLDHFQTSESPWFTHDHNRSTPGIEDDLNAVNEYETGVEITES